MRARNLARAIDHQRRQEQHAMDSSLLAAMASAGDESPGGDGTMNGDGLRAPLETGAREPTPWGNRTIGRDGLRAPLETGVREPWIDRIEPGANDPTTWRDRAIGGGALPGGGSDACAPAVDLAALMQLTAWIKQLGELIRMQDEKHSRLVDLRARAVSVLEAWAQRWYDGQAMYVRCVRTDM